MEKLGKIWGKMRHTKRQDMSVTQSLKKNFMAKRVLGYKCTGTRLVNNIYKKKRKKIIDERETVRCNI